MATMRVHQLAKELDLNSKQLISHLKKLGIDAKNHMSTLSEDDVERVKHFLFPPSADKIIEERLKPTLIRRRRKADEKPPEAETVEELKEAVLPPPAAEMLPQVVGETPSSPPPSESIETLSAAQEAERQVEKRVEKKPEKEPEKEVKIISKKAVIAEEEEEVQRGIKKRKIQRERFTVDAGIPTRKLTSISSKDFREDAEPQEERSRIYKPSPLRKKKALALVKPKRTEITTPKAIKRKIKVVGEITVGQLAKRMSIKVGEVIKRLMNLGVRATMNETIDLDAASLAAHEFGYAIECVPIEAEQILREKKKDSPETLLPRAPIVTVMGHIDHGKTSLLDAIRQSNIIEQEAGGITQHIGAYHVKSDRGDIVFIDTPGHEAFTTMRARGAKATDIVVLVVAADEGVMPQTIEAIDHAKAAQVPIIVAINKIDKPNANPEKIIQSLAEYGIMPESWGGDTLYAEISAKFKKGIENLLEIILLQAEMLELKVNPHKPAKGTVIEAKLDKNHGPVATILVQEGTLTLGDMFIAGVHYGKARMLIDDAGNKLSQTGPSTPVQVLGLSGVPQAGDTFTVVDEEKKARQAVTYFQQKKREKELTETSKVTLEGLYNKIQEGTIKELTVIIKADVHGSLEVLSQSLQELGNKNVKITIIHSAVGSISQSDVMLASASQAIIIGFGVKPDAKAKQLAEQEKVDIRFYNIIYEVISDVTMALEGLLAPTLVEKLCGRAEVKQLFHVSKIGTVGGSMVLEGKIIRNSTARVLRNSSQIHQGKFSSLKRFKDDVREVESGYECGIGIEGFDALEVGDIIESYLTEEIATKL